MTRRKKDLATFNSSEDRKTKLWFCIVYYLFYILKDNQSVNLLKVKGSYNLGKIKINFKSKFIFCQLKFKLLLCTHPLFKPFKSIV